MARHLEDDTDANLTWSGVSVAGAWAWDSGNILGFWANSAQVSGKEYALNFEQESATQSIVNDSVKNKLSAWAIDLGATWLQSSLAFDPRFTLAYAKGSGDSNANDNYDRVFRQTGLQANSPGFGGVQSFAGYGAFLDPELSNITILTAAVGMSMSTASSLDFVYHYYQQVEVADSLGNSRLDSTLTGTNRNLGTGLDLVLAVEEWSQFQFELTASAFRAAAAFGPNHGVWAFGGLAKYRSALA